MVLSSFVTSFFGSFSISPISSCCTFSSASCVDSLVVLVSFILFLCTQNLSLFYLSTYLSIYFLSFMLSIIFYLSIFLSFMLSIYFLSVYFLSFMLSIYFLSIYFSFFHVIYLFPIYLSVESI